MTVIIEFYPCRMTSPNPEMYVVSYKNVGDLEYSQMRLNKSELILLLETYGFATNDLLLLKHFGTNTTNIVERNELKMPYDSDPVIKC